MYNIALRSFHQQFIINMYDFSRLIYVIVITRLFYLRMTLSDLNKFTPFYYILFVIIILYFYDVLILILIDLVGKKLVN